MTLSKEIQEGNFASKEDLKKLKVSVYKEFIIIFVLVILVAVGGLYKYYGSSKIFGGYFSKESAIIRSNFEKFTFKENIDSVVISVYGHYLALTTKEEMLVVDYKSRQELFRKKFPKAFDGIAAVDERDILINILESKPKKISYRNIMGDGGNLTGLAEEKKNIKGKYYIKYGPFIIYEISDNEFVFSDENRSFFFKQYKVGKLHSVCNDFIFFIKNNEVYAYSIVGNFDKYLTLIETSKDAKTKLDKDKTNKMKIINAILLKAKKSKGLAYSIRELEWEKRVKKINKK